MAIIWKNIFYYIKIFLVHPATEITLNIMYLMSFLVIGIILFKSNKNYNDLQILDMTESYLNYNIFSNIKTPSQFNSYLLSILDKLYTINPQSQEIPLFIPISPIRFITFNNSNECNEQIFYNISCRNDSEKFRCVIDYLSKSFRFQCGKKYSDERNFLQNRLTGYYSAYNIRNVKDYIDITRETYYSKYQNNISELIEDKQIKAITMQINLIVPSNNNNIDVILGIEMTNYFTDIKTIFSVYIFKDRRPKTDPLLMVFIIFLCISIIMSIVKFLYEINVKCIWNVHIFIFIIEILDAVFMSSCIIFIIEDKKLDFKVNLNEFESHLRYINIIWFMKLFFSILIFFFPFRVLNLLSWWKRIFEPFIILMNVIFKMMPGVIVSLFFFLMMISMFLFTNYFMYNDIFEYYDSMYNSFISAFNINLLLSVYDRKKPSRIFNNLFQSKFTAFIIFFQIIYFFFFLAIGIATMVYIYKRAIFLLEPPKENKYLLKLKEIEKKLEENKPVDYDTEDILQKQILWMNVDKNNSNFSNTFFTRRKVLFFKNYIQISSYLKYIFAIKPQIQFKKLVHKLNIVVEINQNKIGDNEIKQITHLSEWLIFVGCKLPIIIYGKYNYERNLLMKLSSIYKMIYFINNQNALEKFLEDSGKKVLSIYETDHFTYNSEK